MNLGPFSRPVEDYAPSEPVSRCDITPKPGPVIFSEWILNQFGGTDGGIARECVGAPSSTHNEGRAWDWFPPSRELADFVIACLLREGAAFHELARRAGIRNIIYYERIWNSGVAAVGSAGGRAATGWSRYKHADSASDTQAHRDHVHFSFGWAGARAETSLFDNIGPVHMGQIDQGEHEKKMTDAQAREVLPAAFEVRGLPPPNASAVQAVQAIARFEGGYGHAWGARNWGAVQCKERAPCPPHCVEVTDSDAAGVPYQACMRIYPTHVDGAADLVRQLYRREGVPEALAAGVATRIAERMRATAYFEAPAHKYARAIADNAASIAKSIGEPLAVHLHAPGPAGSGLAALLVLGVVGGAIYWYS